MSELAPGRAHYLESLTRLHRSWAHETRSHLGNVSLQLELLHEHLKRESVPAADRLRAPVDRARQGISSLERCIDRYLGADASFTTRETPPTLAEVVESVSELVTPFARDRRVTWSVETPGPATLSPQDADAAREALAIAAIGLIEDAPAGGTVSLRASGEAPAHRLRLTTTAGSASAAPWLEPARQALGARGGEVVAHGDDAAEMVLPGAKGVR